MDNEKQRMAREAEERAMAEARRVAAQALTGEGKAEALRQSGVIYAGLIGVAVLVVQSFLVATTLDISARISIVSFALAIPLLAALVLVNQQETFRSRLTTSRSVKVAQVVAQLAAFVGLVAAFWHITWVAGVTFLVAAFVALGVHSAGYWRVESPQDPASPSP
jgi:hypothetical protein